MALNEESRPGGAYRGMTRKGPVVNPASDEGKKASGAPGSPDPRRWAFSFRFWRQTEFFGLDKAQPTWFVSLLERLAELSGLVIDDFRSDAAARSYHRYHEIDWDQKNIPVRREDLTWIERHTWITRMSSPSCSS